jgi:phage baseplate assembly protein gpV
VHRVVHTIREIARHEYDQRWNACLGVVKSTQGSNAYSCTVELRESHIVLPEVPIATGLMGTVGLPAENDLVVVLFAGGDLHAPIVVGRLYNEKIAPPENVAGEFLASLPAGETATDKLLELRVNTPGDGSRALKITLDGSVKVEITVDNDGISLKSQDTSLTLKQTSSSDGKAELIVGKSKVTIEQAGNVTIEAEKALTLKASTIEISGDTSVKVAGQKVDIN